MPYIKQEKRDVLDPTVNAVLSALRQLESDDENNNFEGNLNYVISSLIAKCYATSYKDINDVIGVLECIKQEYYYRVAVPYERQKAFENGDVYLNSFGRDRLESDVKIQTAIGTSAFDQGVEIPKDLVEELNRDQQWI